MSSPKLDSRLATPTAEPPQKQSRRRFRFSLRVLFLFTTVAAGMCSWVVLPTRNAKQFIRALNATNYRAADACFCQPDDGFLLKLYEKHWRFNAWAELEPSSFSQLVQGKRLVNLYVAYGDAGPMRSVTGTVVVTGAGLSTPQQVLNSGFSGGMGIASR
jgi:hypothetical protein